MEFFDRIAVQYRKNLPFVVYRKPRDTTVKAIFQSDDGLRSLENFSRTGFVFAPFDTGHPTLILSPDEMLEFSGALPLAHKLGRTPSAPETQTNHLGLSPDTEKKEAHIRGVKKAIDEIGKGTLQKVVLSRPLNVGSNASPLDLLLKLLDRYPNAFCYLWYHPKVGLWLGATPEILLRLQNRQLTTMSLAGTQRYSGPTTPNWGNKELEEQELVTDYIVNALQDQISHLERHNTETVRAGNLLHLRTQISGDIQEGSLEGIVKALHPTPAVCGLPKENARKFIADNENYDRQYYTGFLGELNLTAEKRRSRNRRNLENQAYRTRSKTTTLYVNLRCMQLKNGKAYIYVGGGITKDSDPEKEWEETVAKSVTMLSILK